MEEKLKNVSLATLAGGAAVERFDYELAKVLENIADFNTRPDATREVVLKLKIHPNMDRTHALIEVIINSKLIPIKAQSSSIHLVAGPGGVLRALEYNPAQPEIPFTINAEKES